MAAKTRIVCPHCKKAENVRDLNVPCPACGRPLDIPQEGVIYIYRQGSFYGIAGGFGIYLNEQPFGYIGNKELLRIPVKYGTYNIHCAVGMSRKCRDMQVTVSPQNRAVYAKVYIKPGAWANSFVVEPVDPKLLEF